METGLYLRFKIIAHNRLGNAVRDCRDGHRELHKRSTSIWVGLRSVIRFIHSAINDSWS